MAERSTFPRGHDLLFPNAFSRLLSMLSFRVTDAIAPV
jgi:hypothetical protein